MGIVLREKLNLKESFSQLKVVFILALVLAGLIITTAVIAAPAVAEENPQQWDSLWIGPSNNDDVPHCLAADGKGNLYAIINSVGTGQAVNYLVKFDKDGNEQWPIKLGPIREYTYTVAADNDGNVVTYGGSPATVTKYNSDGKLLWSYVVATNDASRYVAIGNLGDVYITAGLDLTIGDSTESDAIVIKYDKDGNRKWYKSFGTSENETVRGIAVGGPVDGQEVIYVAGATNGSFPGHTFSGNANDGYVAKFLSDGTQDWIEQQNGLDYTDIVADSVGNAYLTETELSYGTPAAISTAVYTKEGKVIRRIPLDSFLVKGYSAGYPSNIAIDPSRNIYVCGAYPKDGSWIPSLLIEKYSPTGNLVGEKRIDIPGVGFPSFELVTGKNGDLYTCYFTNQDMGSNMDYNAHFVKYQGDDYDSDEDGLPDRWETEGVTINGEFIDLPAMGAKPDHKDIFVEVDWMSGREPQKGALDIVRNAYKNAPVENLDGITGINLHIDEGKDKVMDSYTGKLWGDLSKANQTPYVKNLGSFSSGNYNWDEFDQIKNGVETYSPNFDKSRKPIFHYCLFANDYSPNHSSGLSRDNPASDFIVSLGGWNGGKGGTALQQAGTFMHELGHNLGLRHGGVDHISYKPNYLSIMNYAFQTDGLRKLTGDGKTFAGGNFDYSIFNDILNLDTENLNENDGLLSLSNNELLNNYGTEFYFVAPLSAGGGVLTESTNGPRPIDWDRSGGPYLDRVSAPYIAVGPNGDGESGNMVLEAGGEDWHHLVCKGGSIGQLGAINDDLPQQTPVIPEFTWEDEVAQGHEYYVSVTAPENTGIKPGGSSVDYTFTVTNTGQKADTYMLSATSSASWADLTDFPQTISLSPGESTDISINVAVPPDSSETQDELILKATSQETANIWDSSKVVTVLQPDSLGTEQQITSYDGKNATDIIGAAIYGDWVVWADRLHVYPAPTNYYAKNIVSGEKRLIASVNIGNYSLVSFDIFGNMVVYQTDNVIGIYDLSTGTTRQITPGSGEKGFRPRIYGDKVVYESNDCLYVYDLTQNTEQMISDNSAYEWEIYGDRIVWTKPLEEYSYLNDLCVYDLSTNIESTIKSSLSLNHVDIYDNKIVWEDDRTNYWRVYRYDLVTNTEKEVTTFSDPNRSWWNEHWPVIWDDTILEKKCTQSSTTEEVHDIYMYDVNTGSENLIVPNVFYGFSSAYPFTLAFDGRRVVYVKANPTNSFMPLTNLYVTTFNTAPETTLTTDPEIPNDDGWFGQKPPTIALTCDTSGTTTFYQWDSNSDLGWAAYQGTITTPEGEHKLYYYSVDTLGNTESVQGHNFKVDLTPPTTTVTSNPVPGQNIGGWLTVIPQISLSTEDGADSYYQWDSTVGAWSNYTDTIPGQLGEHVLYYYSEDSHGNAEPVQSRPFKVAEADAIPPITTISIEEPPTDGSGYIEGTAVILTVNEPAVTYYQWDVPPSGDIPSQVNIPVMGGSGCFLPANNGTTVYWGKFLVPEGRHTLYYYSVDPSGNVEAAQSNLFEQGILTPTLSIFALDQTRPVGADNPPFTVTTVGLVGADTLDSLNLGYSLSTTATADSPAGTYPITFSGGLTSTETYDPIIYLNGTLTIVESTSQPPIVDAGGDAALEGNVFSRTGSFSDADSTSWTATVDYGDGTGRQDLVLTGTTFNLSHTYADKGVFTVTVTVNDDGNAVGSAAISVTVNNINAGLSINTAVLPDGTVGEDYQSGALNASGGMTPYSWSATGLPAGLTISSSGTISGIPVSPGTSEVVIKVIDSSGKSASAIFTLTIVKISEGGDSDSPTTDAQLSPEPNIAGWNNGSVSVKLEAIDNEGGSGVKTTEYKVGDSSSWTTYTEPFSVTAEGITIVGYRSIDNAGNTEEAKQITINIDTIAPDLTVISPDLMSPLSAGTNTFSFEATDSGSGLKETGALLEDAYGNKTDIENGSSQNLAFGTYTLKVTAVDNAGNGINKENLLVIYDTTGAVTAGGWIDSPSGAYAADPSVTGKANFGIDIKCKKGSNIPEGQTEFQLKDGDINFHSTGYQWFGISGNKAIYKGTGTINNQGDYGFMIWLKDEKDHADKKGMIRIRIWEKGNESFFIYDTQPGDPFDADPTTVLSGGSIVIH